MIKLGVLLLVGALAISTLHHLQLRIDEQRGEDTVLRALMRFPDGEMLKLISLGYNNLVADLIWLRIIQVFGDRTVTEEEYNWIYTALDAVTTLDPRFVQAYLAGSMTLTVMAAHVEQSNRILEKGIAADLEEWRIPFILGFNYFNFLGEYRRAAEYIEMATEMPGRPSWLPLLASRLHVQAKAPQLALEFLARVYESTTDARLREKLEIRIKEVTIERDLMALEQVVQQYYARFGQFPGTLEQLVATELVKRIPLDPFGGAYILDAGSGKVSSEMRPDRMKIHHPHPSVQR